MKCELKNEKQAEYRKDRITLVCIFILVFSLVGILSTFATSPSPDSSSDILSSSSSSSELGSDTSSITLDSSSSASGSSVGESPSGSSAQ